MKSKCSVKILLGFIHKLVFETLNLLPCPLYVDLKEAPKGVGECQYLCEVYSIDYICRSASVLSILAIASSKSWRK